MVADVEKFGDRHRTVLHQQAVRNGLYDVMETAFTLAGMAWEECYREDRGDSVFALVPGETDKGAFLEAALPMLVTRLRVHNDTHPEVQRIRLRVALHAGEVGYDEHGVTSSSLTLAFRLCDAPPLKTALSASPGVLAVIASDWLFDDVVRHTPAAAPATWRPVPIQVKEAATTAWITLPDHPYPADADPRTSGTRTASAGRSRAGAADVVPRQLPGAVRDFTGRAEHLAALDALLPPVPDKYEEQPQSVVITAVDGAGGMGKTTLALHWAHRIQHRFPDGTLHVNLRGYGPGDPATPAEALGGFLRTLGIAARAIPADVEMQSGLLRSMLAGKRVLMVLDNAQNAEQVRPLLPGTAGCMVVITSRDSLTGLVVTDAAHRLTLDLLTPPEALDLVSGILGSERASAERGAVDELVRLCTRLPLALRVAASRAAVHPHMTVAEVVSELADDRTRLDVLSEFADERAAVRAVFDWSYRRLPAVQARLFRRLGLHPGPDLSLPAAAALAGLSPADTRPLLAAVADAHLIEPVAGGRYRFHDLLRTYAADQALHHDTSGDLDRARGAVLTWYIHTAHAADRKLYPAQTRPRDVVPKPAHPYPIDDSDHALAWLTTERDNLIAALHYADERQLDRQTISLTIACTFTATTDSWQTWIDIVTVGLMAARRVGDHTQEAHLLAHRGSAATYLHQWEQAAADLDRVETMVRDLGDEELRVWVLNDQGLLLLKQGRHEDALWYLDEALPLSRDIDTGRAEAVVEGNLSAAYTSLGRYRQALDHGQRGLFLRRKAGDRAGESGALTDVARAQQGLGNHETAITLCREAITLGRRIGVSRDESIATPLDVLATSLHHLGHQSEAIACWQESATIHDDHGLPHNATDVRQRLRDAQNRPDAALTPASVLPDVGTE
ncbi:ATP-binding protein [Amycolatopsis keratiniphila]|uniref:ATP-binding protein n=1 Tax=Amycolatopsis keratiniphila TaxID=129921 RepID=UPI001E2ADED0|nr:tetratricopeptide repeat protein [Amycolatopsis keratiniphila]